jgi:hypothetical protein
MVSLADNRAHEVLFRQGLNQTTCRIDSQIDATWLILDVLTFPIGVVVDAVTSDWKELDKGACHAVLPAAPAFQAPPSPSAQGYPPANVVLPVSPAVGQ